jgi:hypothetical protein
MRKGLFVSLVMIVVAVPAVLFAGCGHSLDPIKRVSQYTGLQLPNDTGVLHDEITWGGKYNMDYLAETIVLDTSNLTQEFFTDNGFEIGQVTENIVTKINALPFPEGRKPNPENGFQYRGAYGFYGSYGYNFYYFPAENVLILYINRG